MKQALGLLFLLMGFCVHTSVALGDTYRVGVYPFPPYFEPDKPGQGVWAKKIGQILKDLGHEAEFIEYPPRRLVRYLLKGRVDLSVGARHPEVDRFVYFTDQPLGEIHLNIYRSADLPEVKTIDDLADKTVIVIGGYSYDNRIMSMRDPNNNITMIEASDHKQAVGLLRDGMADYLMDYARPAENEMDHLKVDKNKFKVDRITHYPVYIALTKKRQKAEDLLAEINAYLAR